MVTQKMVITWAVGPDKGKQVFTGTTDEFEQLVKSPSIFSSFFPEGAQPNFKSVYAMCEKQGWEVQYMEQVFDFHLGLDDALLVRGALADRVNEVRSELEVLKITKERNLKKWERALLPQSLKYKNERDENGHLIDTTREELQEQIDPWISYLSHYEYLLQQVCDGIESIKSN